MKLPDTSGIEDVELFKKDSRKCIELDSCHYYLEPQRLQLDCVPTVFEYLTGDSRECLFEYLSKEDTGDNCVSNIELSDALNQFGFPHEIVYEEGFPFGGLNGSVIDGDEFQRRLIHSVAICFVQPEIQDDIGHVVLFTGIRPRGAWILLDPVSGGGVGSVSKLNIFGAFIFTELNLTEFQQQLNHRSIEYISQRDRL